ncbi:hypothetical protein BSL78_26730 [Apostichopus japonicus]|uniref:Uncharacterized protein n=1 Tax=Stichopus japonicus TaxID=307972 RepID=A0A2G8JL17_STIJA|nr:hypothetical protein BSL78_26730 [Apostichopus japonicus]
MTFVRVPQSDNAMLNKEEEAELVIQILVVPEELVKKLPLDIFVFVQMAASVLNVQMEEEAELVIQILVVPEELVKKLPLDIFVFVQMAASVKNVQMEEEAELVIQILVVPRGTCEETPFGYICFCPDGSIGQECPDGGGGGACDPNPCFNDGSCLELLSQMGHIFVPVYLEEEEAELVIQILVVPEELVKKLPLDIFVFVQMAASVKNVQMEEEAELVIQILVVPEELVKKLPLDIFVFVQMAASVKNVQMEEEAELVIQILVVPEELVKKLPLDIFVFVQMAASVKNVQMNCPVQTRVLPVSTVELAYPMITTGLLAFVREISLALIVKSKPHCFAFPTFRYLQLRSCCIFLTFIIIYNHSNVRNGELLAYSSILHIFVPPPVVGVGVTIECPTPDSIEIFEIGANIVAVWPLVTCSDGSNFPVAATCSSDSGDLFPRAGNNMILVMYCGLRVPHGYMFILLPSLESHPSVILVHWSVYDLPDPGHVLHVPHDPCRNSPCQNGGLCVPTMAGAFVCQCPFSFAGPTCEQAVPRVNVTCPSNVPIFELATGPVALWTIPFCMEGGVPTTQATCDSAPLADLTPGITTVTCTCEGAGVFSASCSFAIVVDGPINPCVSQPCLNGGVCSPSPMNPADFTCACPAANTGRFCQDVVPPLVATCLPEDLSIITFDTGVFATWNNVVCTSPGSMLPLAVTCDQESPALFFGAGRNVVECTCEDTATGRVSQCTFDAVAEVDPCAAMPCLNGGTCSPSTASPLGFTCTCPDGYSGDRCEIEARPVVICPQERDINIFPLGSGAYFVSWPDPQCTSATGNPVDVTCVPPSPTTVFASAAVTFVTCTCTDLGFAGVSASCRFDIDLPVVAPTVTCPSEVNLSILNLPTGGTIVFWPSPQCSSACSRKCSLNILQPCITCHIYNGIQQVTCTCVDLGQTAAGISSDCTFQVDIPDPCANQPCVNDGVCSVNPTAPGGFTCNCVLGFSGLRCEDDPCANAPCVNGGVCSVNPTVPGGFTCNCVLGFSGLRCEDEFTACNPNPCQNGGVCNLVPVAGVQNCPESELVFLNTQPIIWVEPSLPGGTVAFQSHSPGDEFIIGTTPVTYVFNRLTGGAEICIFNVVVELDITPNAGPLPLIAFPESATETVQEVDVQQSPASVRCTVGATPDTYVPSVAWYKDGQRITPGHDDRFFFGKQILG